MQNRAGLIMFLSLVLVPCGAAQVWLRPSVEQVQAGVPRLGSALDGGGITLLVGAPRDSRGGERAGAGILYERVGADWLSRRLDVPGARPWDQTGWSAVLMGEQGRACLGAPLASATGAVHVFERGAGPGSAWTYGARLRPSRGEPNDGFGWTLAADEQRLLIAAPFARALPWAWQSGRVYVFRWDGAWEECSALTSVSPRGGERFGEALAWCGEGCVVGAPQAGGHSGGPGAASGRVEWLQESPFGWSVTDVRSGSAAGERYGSALAFDGEGLWVGVPGRGAAGCVERLEWRVGAWQRTAALTGLLAGEEFGAALAARAGVLLVGAPGRGAGSVERFVRSAQGWRSAGRWHGPSAAAKFGAALTLEVDGHGGHDSGAAVGAPGAGANAGAVAVFE